MTVVERPLSPLHAFTGADGRIDRVWHTWLDKQSATLQRVVDVTGIPPVDFQPQIDAITQDIVELQADIADINSSLSTLSTSVTKLQQQVGDILTPEMFGAVGDGVTDDRTAVQNWLNAISTRSTTATFTIGVANSRYGLSGNVALNSWVNPVAIVGGRPGAGFVQRGGFPDGAWLAVFGSGALGPFTTVTTSAAVGDSSIIVADGTNIDVNDFIRLQAQRSGELLNRQQTTRVIAKTGTAPATLFIETPLAFTINLALDIVEVAEFKAREGFSLTDLSFVGNGTSGGLGVMISFVINPYVKNVRTSNFRYSVAANGGIGLYSEHVYGGTYQDIYDKFSGVGGVGSSLSLNFFSNVNLDNIIADSSGGYGAVVNISNCNLSNIQGVVSQGRGWELMGACSNRLTNIAVHRAAATGLSLVYGCSNNILSNIIAVNNAHQNVWSNGVENVNNTYVGVVALHAGIGPDLLIASTPPDDDTGATVIGLDPRSTKSVRPDTVLIPP